MDEKVQDEVEAVQSDKDQLDGALGVLGHGHW